MKNFKKKIECIRKILKANFFEIVIVDGTGIEAAGVMPERISKALFEAIEDVVIEIRREVK